MDHRACPVCGSDRGGAAVADVRMRAPDGHPLGDGYSVVSCYECGTGFADAVVAPEYYERYYETLAKYANEVAVYSPGSGGATPAASADEPPWLAAKTESSASRIASVVGSRDARVLDVGCSTGLILGALARRGYRNLQGIDPSPDSVRIANLRPGVRARVGTFSNLPDDLGDFDCICATGVLEHLWDPAAAIRALCGRLAPGGAVYVEVPDASRYLDPYVAPFEDFSTEHVNHLSFPGLRRLAARSGLETVAETSYVAPLTPAVGTRCAAVTWRFTKAAGRAEARDDALERVLVDFAARSRRDLARVESALEHSLGARRDYAVWGIGEAAFKLLALEPLESRHAVAYVDASPSRRGFSFAGRQVVAPADLPEGDVPLVVASFIRADSIAAAAESLGLANPIVRVDGAVGPPTAG